MSLGPVSKDLIVTAIRGESGEARALATQAIGRRLRDYQMTRSERDLSARLFNILSKDVCEEVRRALSVTLRLSKNLPVSVASRLIADIDSIALPILASSPNVSDDDLLTVLHSRAADRVRAVATRNGVSVRVSHAVINSGDVVAIRSLAANDSALISPEDAKRLVKLAGQDDLIREAALRRQDMPQDLAVDLIERQVERLDQTLSQETSHHTEIAADTESRAKASWSGSDWSADAMMTYVSALQARGALTESVLARAAGQGDWRFVQVALARLAGISAAKARMIVLDPRPFGLSALLTRAKVDAAASDLIMVSASAFRDLQQSGQTLSRARFQRLMTERIASHPAATQHEILWMDWLDDGLQPKLV